jgi:hypothetical protein
MDEELKVDPADMETPDQPEPEHKLTRRERRNRKKLLLLIIGGVVALLLLAGAAYWFFLRDKGAKTPAADNTAQTEEEPAPEPVTADPTPVAYKSAKYNIELTHRKDWTLKEAADGEITITSPPITYSKVEGESASGVFSVKFRVGVPEAMKETIEKAVAPRKSEVIAYAEPTKEQRQYTNLSYAGTKEAFNFFIVTGNAEFKAGAAYAFALPLDGQFYMLVGGYGADADGTLSFDSVPAASMDSEALSQAIDIVESLKIY